MAKNKLFFKQINKANYLLFTLSALFLLNGCIYQNLSSTINKTDPTTIQAIDKLPTLEILIEQKKNNGELISIGSKAVKNVIIDDVDYPSNKLVNSEFKIDVPSVSSGKHKLEVSLYFQNANFSVPLIIPNAQVEKIYLLLRVNIDEKTGKVIKVEYGYDFDRNGSIDNNREKFELNDKEFFIIYKDNTRKKIDFDFNTSTIIPDEKLPVGIVPSDVKQAVDINLPQTKTIEIPKPQLVSDGLYPLPPSINKIPEPILPSKNPNQDSNKDNEIEEIQ
ncbi:MAG: hypothetical protein U0457_10210 [Candidatus Sericytochromatia bacterium]